MFRTSIRNKLILFLLCATIVPFATSIVVTYLFTKEKVTSETITSNSSLIAQGKTNLTNYLESVLQNSLSIYTNDPLYEIIDVEKEIDYESREEIRYALQVMSHSIKNTHQIYMYLEVSDLSYLMMNGILNSAPGRDPKYTVTFPPNQDVFFEASHPTHTYGMALPPYRTSYLSPSSVITMHRKIINFPVNQTLGVLSIDLDLGMIQSISEQLYDQNEEELYILDSTGRIVYGPNKQQWGELMTEKWATDAAQSPDQRGSFDWTNSNFSGIHIYEKMKTDYLDWTIVKRIPYEQLHESARQLTLINSLVLSFFLIIVIIATLYISIKFTAPIKALIRYIHQIQTGNLNVDIDLKRSDELGILANRFSTMMQSINNLIMQEYRLELANKNNQLRALQAQINPHFLNNALQSIGTLALQHQAPRIYALIASLGKMMRYSMNTNESYVPFYKELDHVKSYLELQMQRFEHQLEIEYQIDEDSKSIEIPKMILQPIVENYFKHGFEPSLGIGTLKISSAIIEADEGSHLEILVEDNGQGMSNQRLQEVLTQLSSKQNPEGIGLRNVLTRLQLYFDPSVRLDIRHRMPQGVQVVLTIPLQKEDKS
jgi:two-component system sensor histidine kinase YesM